MTRVGDLVTVDIERPTAGGRMLARHDGQITFITGTIPGERVSARVTRVAKGVIYADVVDVLTSSPDRRESSLDGRCGGNVMSHIAPTRQVLLKGEIIEDAFRRIARLPLGLPPDVVPSPEHGYRMRARLHVDAGRIGFLRESSHDLCDVAATGQLMPEAVDWIRSAEARLASEGDREVRSIELAENVAGTERACHLELAPGASASRYQALARGLSGLSVQRGDGADVTQIAGSPTVTDVVTVRRGDIERTISLQRDVRAFFQGNRYLLQPLVEYVAGLVPPGPVVDLYAGVGLFGLALATLGHDVVTLVEGDRLSGTGLVSNATPFGHGVQVQRMSVEQFLAADRQASRDETVVLDPPRTGVSPEAMTLLIRRAPSRLVYVSCDVATLARDARALSDAGYGLSSIRGFDLFPNTAHVESVSVFTRVDDDDEP